jgi:hypothetical protein
MLSRTFILRDKTHAEHLWNLLRNNWQAMADAGKPLAVTVQEHKAKRSVEQNRLYWQRLNEIAENAWIDGKRFSAEAWHEFFKIRFIGCEELPRGGTVGISTTTLCVADFSDYIGKVEAYATTELGIELN